VNNLDENKARRVMSILVIVQIVVIVSVMCFVVNKFFDQVENGNIKNYISNISTDSTFRVISSSENEDLEPILKEYSRDKNINLEIEYAGTLDIMEKLNSAGNNYDAVWTSNSIWLYMLNSSVKVSESKSTSINPVVFAVKKSKAKELGFENKEIYTKDIVKAIQDGKLKFSMSNPTQTNTGATAYLGLLSSIAGSPEVLKKSDLENEIVKKELVSLFTGLERSSGSEDFLEEMFLNGAYEAVVTYEASIININKQLEENGKETLYVLYPVDGVSISDSPFAYINNGDDNKKEQFLSIQSYILSNEGQEKLAKTGRRTWYGGINSNVDKNIFNPNWGINTEKYIVPIKFPSTTVIQDALAIYQTELRKPIHAVFCLDYSGSMAGNGYNQLLSAMEYILTEEKAKKDLLQFSEKDKITVIPFSSQVINKWNTNNGLNTISLLNNIKSLKPTGSTNIYDTSIEALKVLANEDYNKYNASIILMTDGLSNMGSYQNLKNYYYSLGKEIPIYSIMFGSAHEDELQEIADLTNAKIFDGRTDLLKAFKEVRGYN